MHKICLTYDKKYYKSIQSLVRKREIEYLVKSCPRFWEDCPKDDPGPWVAAASTVYFYENEKKRVLVYANAKAAYFIARKLALELQYEIPGNKDFTYGINWLLRKPISGEYYDKVIGNPESIPINYEI